MGGQAWQRVHEALFVEQAEVTAPRGCVMWQSRQRIPACGPGASWKQASWAAKRAPRKVAGEWQSRQLVPKPAAAWSMLTAAVRA
jgi:hypothetical protein